MELTIITDEAEVMTPDCLTEGLGLRRSGDKEFVFTKAGSQRAVLPRNPRIYSGAVVHSSLRKDGKYGISAVIDLSADLERQHRLALAELDEVFDKFRMLA